MKRIKPCFQHEIRSDYFSVQDFGRVAQLDRASAF